jgi:hypothetical protein
MSEQLIEVLNRIADALEQAAEAQQRLAGAGTAERTPPKDDGREAEATEMLKANSTLSGDHIVAMLKARGIIRNRQWVLAQRYALGLPVGRQKGTDKLAQVNHRGLKVRARDYREFDLGAVPASEIPEREAFAIEAIRQNPEASTAELCFYIREHRGCGLALDFEWIDSHRGR